MFSFSGIMRGVGGRTDAGLIGIFPSADPLSLDEKRSGTKLARGSRQRRLPRLVKCRRFPTVCSRKYTQLTQLTLSPPLTIPKRLWRCRFAHRRLWSLVVHHHLTSATTTVPSLTPSRHLQMSLRYLAGVATSGRGDNVSGGRVDSVGFRPLENACT